jgi:hypothetical protein
VVHEGVTKPRQCFIELRVNRFTLPYPASQHPALVQVPAKLVVLGNEPCASCLGVHDWTFSQAPSQADQPTDGEITKIVRDRPNRAQDARGSERSGSSEPATGPGSEVPIGAHGLRPGGLIGVESA